MKGKKNSNRKLTAAQLAEVKNLRKDKHQAEKMLVALRSTRDKLEGDFKRRNISLYNSIKFYSDRWDEIYCRLTELEERGYKVW